MTYNLTPKDACYPYKMIYFILTEALKQPASSSCFLKLAKINDMPSAASFRWHFKN